MAVTTLPSIIPSTDEGAKQIRFNNSVAIALSLLNQYAVNSTDVQALIDLSLSCNNSALVLNDTGSTLSQYTVVALDLTNGWDITTGAFKVVTMNDVDLLPIGVLTKDIDDGETDTVYQFDTVQITGFDTTSASIGDLVYIDTSDGSLSLTTNKRFPIGTVGTSDANGVVKFDFTLLFSKLYETEVLITDSDSPYTCTGREKTIICDTTNSSGAIAITLASAANMGQFKRTLIKDNGNASTHNVTFTGTVEGGTPTTFTANYASLEIISDGTSLLDIS